MTSNRPSDQQRLAALYQIIAAGEARTLADYRARLAESFVHGKDALCCAGLRLEMDDWSLEVGELSPDGGSSIELPIGIGGAKPAMHGRARLLVAPRDPDPGLSDEARRYLDAVCAVLSARLEGLLQDRPEPWSDSVLAGTDDLMAFVDPDYCYRYVNQAYCRMLHRTRAEILGQPVAEIVGERFFRETVRPNLERCLRGESVRFESEHPASFGAMAIDVSCEPQSDPSGQVIGAVVTIRDASPLRPAQAALLESEARYRALVESMPDWIWETDASLRYTYASPAVEQILGYPPAQLLGKTPFDLMPADEARGTRALVEPKRAAAQPIETIENIKLHRDGRRLVLETRALPVLDAAGALVGYRGIDRDITGRKQAQAALERERDRVRHYLNIAGAMLIALDTAGRVTLINRQGCEILGLPEDAVIGRDWFESFLPQDCVGAVRRVFEQLMAGVLSPVEYFDNDVLTGRGERRTIKWHNSITFDATGHINGVLSSGEDVTEQRRIESLFHEAQRIGNLGFFELARDGKGLWCSDGMLRIHGLAPEQEPLSLDALLAIVVADDREPLGQAIELAAAPPARVERQYRVRMPDGMLAHLIMSAQWRAAAPGDRPRLIGTCQQVTERALAEARLRFQAQLLDSVRESVVATDLEGKVTYWGRGAEALYHHRAEDVLGKPIAVIVDPPNADEERQRIRAAIDTGVWQGVYKQGRRDGSWFWADTTISLVRDAEGHPVGLIGIDRDVTEDVLAQERLRLAQTLLEHTPEAVMITDRDQNIIDVNPAFSTITGYTRDEALGRHASMLKSGRHDPAFYEHMWTAIERDGEWTGEIWNRKKDGSLFVESMSIMRLTNTAGEVTHYAGVFTDATDETKLRERLQYLAYHDALTGLPNRKLLADRLQTAMVQAQRSGRRIALAYLDLDGFKAINDRHGHETGDQLLIRLGQRLRAGLRAGDTLARFGGDELVALMVDFPIGPVGRAVLDRLLQLAAAPVEIDATIVRVSASIGVACYPQAQEMTPGQLLCQADDAMYQAKIAGKNRYRMHEVHCADGPSADSHAADQNPAPRNRV